MSFAASIFWAESMKIKTKDIEPEYLREYLTTLLDLYEKATTEGEYLRRRREEAVTRRSRTRWGDFYSENLVLMNDILKNIEKALSDHNLLDRRDQNG